MKYSDLVKFDPIEEIIHIASANDSEKAADYVRTYVMSAGMAEQLNNNLLSQLKLDDAVNNKGIFLVGNYGTGKTHLMSLISSIALDEHNLQYLRNDNFAKNAEIIAGRFEVLRIELGSVTTPLREIVLSKIRQDFKNRDLTYDYPAMDSAASNKDTLRNMMEIFATKYPDKGYLIAVDEFLDFLGGKDDTAVRLDLGFMRELGELVKESGLRVIFGVQEQLFDNPNFSFVWELINKIRERFNQVLITKEDTAYVVSERILKKNDEQKASIREHLQKFCSLYSNMSERLEEFVGLYPIHPSFIEVFNKVYIAENRSILANISTIVNGILDNDVDPDMPGIVSFDNYWAFIRDNFSYRSNPNIKEVVEKSGQLEDIVSRAFPKKQYKPLAHKIIQALSVHRLTTADVEIRTGLTSENLRDDLCLYIKNLPDQSSDTLQTLVQTVLKDIMTTVSGQFIDHNKDNGQYYLDLKKDIDYDEKIKQRASTVSEDILNRYFFDIVLKCMEWEDKKEHVPNFKIYDHTLNWHSHNIFRTGYVFFGTPESRPTAQPPEDYYIYFIPPYGNPDYKDEKKTDEVFFIFKGDEEFKNNLKLYAAALIQRGQADEKNKATYQSKADGFYRKLALFLSENKNTCFDVIYNGVKKQLIEVLRGNYKRENPFRETIDLAASLMLDNLFNEIYSKFPVFKTVITLKNQAEAVKNAYSRFAGRKEQLGNAMLDSFGLLSGDNITIKNSVHADYYASELNKLPVGAVLNFNDIYDTSSSRNTPYIDKEYKLPHNLLSIALLGLVHDGVASITLKNGTSITASNLESISKDASQDSIYDFKHISRPKDLPLAELMRLFEVLELPVGLIRDPNSREDGLDKLITEAQKTVNMAVTSESRLAGDFSLWGEPLIAVHLTIGYKQAAKCIAEMLGNFQGRFNTIAKLNNFTYTTEEIDKLAAGISDIKTINELNIFKNESSASIGYLMNIESLLIGDALKSSIENAKTEFRRIRGSIVNDRKLGTAAAKELEGIISIIKQSYADAYYDEHNKHRLTASEYKQKTALMDSKQYDNLKRLSAINEILSVTKFSNIDSDLAALKVCYELTPEALKTSHLCKCGFQLGSNEPLARGMVDAIEDRISKLTEEWTNALLSEVSDPLAKEQKDLLSPEQRSVIDTFEANKALPETVDQLFVSAIKDLLKDYDVVNVESTYLVDKLTSLGACDPEILKQKIEAIIEDITKGKDKSKLRIIIRETR